MAAVVADTSPLIALHQIGHLPPSEIALRRGPDPHPPCPKKRPRVGPGESRKIAVGGLSDTGVGCRSRLLFGTACNFLPAHSSLNPCRSRLTFLTTLLDTPIPAGRYSKRSRLRATAAGSSPTT